jgi:hypothetical protein
MLRHVLAFVVAVGAVGGAATSAAADHIPGHNNSDPTFPVPLPGADVFTGGAISISAIGPPAGTIITNTTFDITYVSDGATPASNLLLEVSVQVDNDFAELSLTGADLGFGGGPGTFVGTLQTDVFNGVVWQSFFPPTNVHIHIQSTTGGIDGTAFFVDSAIIFDVIPVPAPAGVPLLALGLLQIGRGRRRPSC